MRDGELVTQTKLHINNKNNYMTCFTELIYKCLTGLKVRNEKTLTH